MNNKKIIIFCMTAYLSPGACENKLRPEEILNLAPPP